MELIWAQQNLTSNSFPERPALALAGVDACGMWHGCRPCAVQGLRSSGEVQLQPQEHRLAFSRGLWS